MIDIGHSLETSPNALATRLPAGRVTDMVMTRWDEFVGSRAPHLGSPACLDIWEEGVTTLQTALSTCANPDTLQEAFDRYRKGPEHAASRLAIVTNPATPRTPEVIRATAKLDQRLLTQAFVSHYVSPRRFEYDREVHADLIDSLTRKQGSVTLLTTLGKHLGIHWRWNLNDVHQFTHDHLLPRRMAKRVNKLVDLSLSRYNRPIIGREPAGDLTIEPTEHVGPRHAELLGRKPESLTMAETAELRELTMGLDEQASHEEQKVTLLGVHTLNYRQAQQLGWAREFLPGEVPTNGLLPHWVRTWVESGLDDIIGFNNLSSFPPAVMSQIGAEAWAEFGDDPAAWTVFLEFLEHGWDDSFQDLLATVAATT